MKKFLLIGLIIAASTAAVAASGVDQAASPQLQVRPAAVSHKFEPLGARPVINCGFICDSFGRCYRVCW